MTIIKPNDTRKSAAVLIYNGDVTECHRKSHTKLPRTS